MFLHILGSDISHHNRTLLTFFSDEIAPHTAEKPRFFLVGQDALYTAFPQLDLTIFSTKKALAKAVLKVALQDTKIRFFLHGQYNLWLWLAILSGKLPPSRCVWHIWGADLYETSKSMKFQLFYPVRRMAQKRLNKVCGTLGDLDYFSKINAKSDRLLLYFPTRLPSNLPKTTQEINKQITVLLGNSGDPSNQHLQGLQRLKQIDGIEKIIVPMGYPTDNQSYILQVENVATQLFSQNKVQIWREQVEFEQYIKQIAQCDFGYFGFERQQGIGTLCLLIAMNIPFALNRKNPFCLDLIQQNIPFIYIDELSYLNIVETKRRLQRLDKSQIAFFPPNYSHRWLEILCK